MLEKFLNKNFLTNFTAAFLILLSQFLPSNLSAIFFSIGIFSLSGAITNSLAIHMLFEKVPFLYGSGVIPNRFEDFKLGIKRLIITEFFSKAHIEKFFKSSNLGGSAKKITSKIDFEKVYQELLAAIMESPFGNMINMFGGSEALAPIKEPIQAKLKNVIDDLVKEYAEDSKNQEDITNDLIIKIENIIDERLSELTPEKVKEIIQEMIRKHLGWLVVWGGVFGALIGLLVAIF
jgi:uncharacterized membrane protein YheB (UPF0754 family)